MDAFDDFPGLQAFERIASLGSLTLAAAEIGISLGAISKRLASFEGRLGNKLINRTTRYLALTEEGRVLYPHAQRLMQDLHNAREALASPQESISGLLSITAPNSVGRRRLLPLLAEFGRRYPAVRIQLLLSDEIIDLGRGGIDVALRYGKLTNTPLVAKQLIHNRRILCASPEYLARRGHPQILDDLSRHDCILIGQNRSTTWRFTHQHTHQQTSIRVEGRYICSDGDAAYEMALQGMGIVFKSWWDVEEDIFQERLIPVLPELMASASPLNVLYQPARPLPIRVKALVDFLVEKLRA